jgi:hypothetical protein
MQNKTRRIKPLSQTRYVTASTAPTTIATSARLNTGQKPRSMKSITPPRQRQSIRLPLAPPNAAPSAIWPTKLLVLIANRVIAISRTNSAIQKVTTTFHPKIRPANTPGLLTGRIATHPSETILSDPERRRMRAFVDWSRTTDTKAAKSKVALDTVEIRYTFLTDSQSDEAAPPARVASSGHQVAASAIF